MLFLDPSSHLRQKEDQLVASQLKSFVGFELGNRKFIFNRKVVGHSHCRICQENHNSLRIPDRHPPGLHPVQGFGRQPELSRLRV